jgi:DNA-binding phage protein
VGSGGLGCYAISGTSGGSAQTVQSLSKDATVVVEGSFKSYGSARWNTPNGNRPSKDEVQAKTARLYRPIAVGGLNELVGAVGSKEMTQRGGRLDCDSVLYDGDDDLKAGQDYVYFLVTALDSDEQPTDRLLLLAAWPVRADGKVQTAEEGGLTIAELKQAISNGGLPPQETPIEPTTGPQG